MYYILVMFGIFASVIQLGWTIYLFFYSKSVFTMGFYLVFVLSLFHLCFYLIKRCIFDRGLTTRSRSLRISCLGITVSDPYDMDVFVENARIRNKEVR